MARPMGSAVRSAFTADSRERIFIGQAWVRTQTYSKPSVKLVIWLQIKKKVMPCSPMKTREVHSCSTW